MAGGAGRIFGSASGEESSQHGGPAGGRRGPHLSRAGLYEQAVRCIVCAIMKQRHSFSVVVLLAAGMLGGCMSSPQMSRIDRNRHVYETWPLETRQAVLDGKVEPGMNPDMVRVAWGEPSQVATSPAGDEIWVYQRGGDPGSVYYPGGGAAGYPGGVYPGGIYPGGGYPGGVYPGGAYPGGVVGGPGIGISTGRGGTSIGATGGIGIGGGGVGMGGTGLGGVGPGPIVTAPTPPEVREVVFRNGVVLKADAPFNTK